MRRMYSEQELSVIVYQVMGQYIENGAFNQTIDNYIDAYLVEHPVDPTAITGLDIAPKNVTASGNITAPSIIENMNGYSFVKATGSQFTFETNLEYVGCVKNGNKLSLVICGTITPTNDATGFQEIGRYTIPNNVAIKIIPSSFLTNVCDIKRVNCLSSVSSASSIVSMAIFKTGDNILEVRVYPTGLTTGTKYYFRYESTFLLSDSLYSQE